MVHISHSLSLEVILTLHFFPVMRHGARYVLCHPPILQAIQTKAVVLRALQHRTPYSDYHRYLYRCCLGRTDVDHFPRHAWWSIGIHCQGPICMVPDPRIQCSGGTYLFGGCPPGMSHRHYVRAFNSQMFLLGLSLLHSLEL
jgi:hypothetical protein